MAEIENKESFAESLKKKLCTLFLYTAFTEPKFLAGEIAKHLDVDVSEVSLTKVNDVEEENYSLYSLKVFGVEFVIRFNHKVEELKDRQVPKLVKAEKKWWQMGEPDTKVVIEAVKPKQKERDYWVVHSISA